VEDGITGMRVTIEGTVNAPPERVWDLIADVTHIPDWSPECVRAQWLDSGDSGGGPRVGARFIGYNRMNKLEWQVLGEIVECDRPRSFGWLMLDDTEDPDRPSSRWRYELEPLDAGRTMVRESFEHGPGESRLRMLLRERPEWDVPAVVEFRRQRLLENMTATLAAMARTAEATA